MKKMIAFFALFCILLVGCAPSQSNPDASAGDETADAAVTLQPLSDNTMDNLTDAVLSVSLEEGDAYLDDSGIMQMDLTVYTYDRYDMIDIAALKVGDTIVRNSGDVLVESLERNDAGTVYINGGLEEGGFDLVTDDSGTFFETGYNDARNWYEAGEATIRVSTEFVYTDNANPDAGEVVYYPGSFLTDEVTDYDFTPYNTTVRVEEGQIVAMERRYMP